MKVYLSNNDFYTMILNLVRKIIDSKRNFTRVVGIANGGLPVSTCIAEALDLPHESVRISHYDGSVLRDMPIIEGQLTQPTSNLIVDDLIDGGLTYRTFVEHFGLEGNAMAVLFWNTEGPKPDFYAAEKPAGWVVFPYEEEWNEKYCINTRENSLSQ